MQITFGFSFPRINPTLSMNDFGKGVVLGMEMISRYFSVDFRQVAARPQMYIIVSPWPYSGYAWEDRIASWGYRVPAIYVSATRTLVSSRVLRHAIAHELCHWFTGPAHASGNHIMDPNLLIIGNWSEQDYARLKTRLAIRPGSPIPKNDQAYWVGK